MDIVGCCLAFGDATAGKNYLCGVEGDEVAGCFEAEADVGAGYYYGLAFKGGGRDGEGLPLILDEVEDGCHDVMLWVVLGAVGEDGFSKTNQYC